MPAGKGVNREKQGYRLVERMRLPSGQTIIQLRKKQEVINGGSDDVDSIDAGEDDELIDQLDGLNFT